MTTAIEPGSAVPAASPVLQFQLEILKLEIETINGIVGRHDEITQTTKNWAVVTWAGGVGLSMQQPELRPCVMVTALIPLLFWFIDAQWRRLQARSTFRSEQIREFLNDDRLARSFVAGKVCEFVVFDPVAGRSRGIPEYQARTSLWRTFRYPEVCVFYSVPIVISTVLGGIVLYLKVTG